MTADWRELFEPRPEPVPGEVAPYVGEGMSRYGAAAIERECEAVAHAPEGTRNDTLNRASFNLSQLIASGHLDADYVHGKLTNAALAAGLPGEEIQRTLASGYRAGVKAPRAVAPLENLGEVHVLRPARDPTETGEERGAGEGEAGAAGGAQDAEEEEVTAKDVGVEPWVRANLPVLDWWDLWEKDEEEDWIVEPLIPAGRLVALYSPPKVGKSLLLLELSAAVAAGRSVLGNDAGRPRRVLYVDFENDPRGDVRPRLQAMGYGPKDLDGLAYLSFPTLNALDSDRGGAELLAAVTVYKAELVVIDTVSRAVTGEENDNDTWLRFYRSTGVRLKAAGVACVRLDHAGKDVTRGQRGGSAKAGDADLIWRMERMNEVTYTLQCEAHRLPVADLSLVIKRQPLPHLRSVVEDSGYGAGFLGKVAEVVALMDAAELPYSAGRRAARAVVRETGLSASNKILDAACQRRAELGGVFELPGLENRDDLGE